MVAAALATAVNLPAQVPGAGQAGVNGALLKLFGASTAFSAKADVRMLDAAGQETLSLVMDFALLNGEVRAEIDMAQLRSADLDAAALDRLKPLGLDRVVTVVRPGKKSALVIYPALRGYAETPMTVEAAAEFTTDYKMQRTLLVKETIGPYACEKSKVVLTPPKGARQEAVVWFAPGLKDFPVKVQMHQADATVVMQFRDLTLRRPDAKLFEAPAGYARHPSVEALVRLKVSQEGR
jgi:hypothetical protein